MDCTGKALGIRRLESGRVAGIVPQEPPVLTEAILHAREAPELRIDEDVLAADDLAGVHDDVRLVALRLDAEEVPRIAHVAVAPARLDDCLGERHRRRDPGCLLGCARWTDGNCEERVLLHHCLFEQVARVVRD